MSWNVCKFDLCENWTARPDGDYCETHRRSITKQAENEQKQIETRKKAINKQQQVLTIKADITKPIYWIARTKKAIRKLSKKREELNKEYFKLVEQFKKDNPQCHARINELCTKSTDEPHHRKGRGVYLLDTTTWLPVCRACHSYIEGHPKEAKEKGWSESRLATIKQTI